MKKTKSKIAIFFSVVSMPFLFGCDFRHKEEKPPMDEDNTCVITWQNKDGTILNQEVYEKGDYPSYKFEDPQFEDKSGDSYRFTGWEPDIDQVNENTTFTATYEKVEGSKFSYRLDSSGEFYRLIKFSPSETETSVFIESTYNDKPVKVIDNYALKGCKSIKSITLSNGLEEIADCAFQNTSISKIVIPDSVKKMGTNIFKDCKYLTSVTFPSGIETIPERTFYNCDSLTTISIPNTIKTIGAKSFYNCSYLNTVNIPNNVEAIENKAFYQCEKLKNVNIDPDESSLNIISSYAFSETDITSFTLTDKVDTINEYTFANCPSLQTFTIPDTLTDEVKIKESAFEGCSNLSSFITPNNNVTSIEKRAFRDCKSLSSFTLSPSISIIEDSAFQNCQSLANLNISSLESLLKIGDKAFYNTAFTSIKIPQNVNYFGDKAFGNCPNLKNVIFPGEEVIFKTDLDNTFFNCPKFTSNYIDPGKTNLTKAMFSSSSSSALTNLSIPNNINSISSDALNNCTNLIYNDYPLDSSEGYICHYLGNSSNPYLALISADISSNNTLVKIHDDCKVIADSVFQDFNKPFSVEINGFIRNLGDSTFKNSALTNISFTTEASLAEIKSNVFVNSQLESITLPKDITGITGTTFMGCANLTSIYTSPDNLSPYKTFDNKLLVENGILRAGIKNYDFNGKELNDEIKVIDSYAFSDRYKLSYLNLPSSVETIKSYAFNNCSTITKTVFGCDEDLSQLKEIQWNAFSGLDINSSTTREIRFRNTIDKWLSLRFGTKRAIPNSISKTNYYFTKGDSTDFELIDSNLTLGPISTFSPYVLAGCQAIQSIEVDPKNLTEIGDYAFYGATNLQNLFLTTNEKETSISITRIGDYAFYNCSSLKNFTMKTYSRDDIDNTELVAFSIARFEVLREIGSYAFGQCSNLTTSLYFRDIQKMAPNAFYGATSTTTLFMEISRNITFGKADGISFAGFSSLEELFIFIPNTRFRITIESNCFSSIETKVKLKMAYFTNKKSTGYPLSMGLLNTTLSSIKENSLTNSNTTKTIIFAYTTYAASNPPDYNYWYYDNEGYPQEVIVS